MSDTHIHTFIRHCNFSSNSAHKQRPDWFTREKCWNNLLNTIDDNTSITILFDGYPNDDHFLKNQQDNFKIINISSGNDGLSFLNLVKYIEAQNIPLTDIIYILEDDYLHRPLWPKILREGLEQIKADYVTLYDHPDKYFLSMYKTLQSQIFISQSTHWRTTPSTTNTYASLYQTFIQHIDIHKKYCDLNIGFTRDHDKFLNLWQNQSNLISPIPSYATHCETQYISPYIKWEQYA